MKEIHEAIDKSLSKRAHSLLMGEISRQEQGERNKDHLHSYWKGVCDFMGWDASDLTMRMGCGIINGL